MATHKLKLKLMSHIKIAMDMAIADAGATGHFLLPGTSVQKQQPT